MSGLAPSGAVEARPGGDGDIAVRLRGVGKRYDAIVALDAVDLDVRAGHVHAFVGENGAGKSTCLGLLAGRTAATSGMVHVLGRELATGDPRVARRAGVAAIYQELTIAPTLSTQANVFMGQDLSRGGVLREAEMRARFVALCEEIGVSVPTDVEAGTLSVGDQQLVEIMRALVARPRVILFDEPSQALAVPEREALYRVIRRLRDQGTTIVLVSHDLDEVLDLSDHVTVFRNGRLISTAAANEWTKDGLVRAMIGRDLGPTERTVASASAVDLAAPPVLAVRGLHVHGLRDVAVHVRRGEILGVGGLVGSGRSTLLRALAGDLPVQAGRMEVAGEPVRWPSSVRRARRHGIVLIPEDRKRSGLFHELDGTQNVLVGDLGSVSRFGIISPRRERAAATAAAGDMGFAVDRLGGLSGTLSGGNQQKLLLARAGHARPAVLLADEPTRGVDVGAKGEIMRTLERLAADGMAVVVVSSELEDLTAMCDRVVVLSRGEVTAELHRSDGLSVSSILHHAFRAEEAS